MQTLPEQTKSFDISHKKLDSKIKQVEEELNKLGKSYRVQEIWPEAFFGGYTCSLHLVKKMAPYPSRSLVVVKGYMKRSDGTTFNVTKEQVSYLLGGCYFTISCKE